MARYAELEYFCQASMAVASNQNVGNFSGVKGSNNLSGKKAPATMKVTPTDDFIGMDNNGPDERK